MESFSSITLKISLVVPQKLNIVLPEGPAIPLLSIYSEDAPTCNKDTCSTRFLTALFILSEAEINPDIIQQRNGYRKCGTFTQWNTVVDGPGAVELSPNE